MLHRLPLFPLGSVLFPGLPLPLHIFEQRYRRLVSDLLDAPSDTPRHFGVVGIELGHEVGERSAQRLFEVGCTAEIRTSRLRGDGRYDLVVEGGRRFRIDELLPPDDSFPYLRASTTPLPDEDGPGAGEQVDVVARLFGRYCERLTGIGIPADPPADFPTAPLPVSYAVSAAIIVNPDEKQGLLEADHAAARLERAAALLRRENRVLASLPTLPAGQFLRQEINLN
ncbi:LON peptidase substrate-binding domain-containing protein [Marinactinospora thermotolerans]|uniref:LON peptidase substrate-binding domain-containing protein n=1 Tax=Marinactinospora thermotolerans TaxID=531310 RepID=UPI003D8C0333